MNFKKNKDNNFFDRAILPLKVVFYRPLFRVYCHLRSIYTQKYVIPPDFKKQEIIKRYAHENTR